MGASLLNQTYTSREDALVQFIAWSHHADLVALGWDWTVEYGPTLEGTATPQGKRAHISRTINSVDCFFNFRTSDGVEDISTAQGGEVAGIAVNGSTEYTGTGVAWDNQGGHTCRTYLGTTDNVFGNADKLKASGGACHFFATDTSLTGVFESESDTLDWRMITIGLIGVLPAYFASGGAVNAILAGQEGDYDDRSSYCSQTDTQGTGTAPNAQSAVWDGTGWFTNYIDRQGNTVARILNNLIWGYATAPTQPLAGSPIAEILFETPDAFRGNAQIFPSEQTVTQGTLNEHYPIGSIEGVGFINMTNYNNEQEITNGAGKTYKLFKIWNPGPIGVAFLTN